MAPLTLFFLVATAGTAALSFFLVGKMAEQLKRARPGERKAPTFLNLPGVVREYDRAFPRSGLMLAFWLSVIFLVVWVACLVFSLRAHM